MQAFVDKVLAMTGLHNDVRVSIDPRATGCAYATTRGGKQYIGVDLACVGPLRSDGTYNWEAVGALTHEIGHLLSGHTTNGTHSHQEESEADEWAGWAMARLGATLEEAQTFYETTSTTGSKTHPRRAVRLESVGRGWNNARGGSTPVVIRRVKESGWEGFMKTPLPWAQPESK